MYLHISTIPKATPKRTFWKRLTIVFARGPLLRNFNGLFQLRAEEREFLQGGNVYEQRISFLKQDLAPIMIITANQQTKLWVVNVACFPYLIATMYPSSRHPSSDNNAKKICENEYEHFWKRTSVYISDLSEHYLQLCLPPPKICNLKLKNTTHLQQIKQAKCKYVDRRLWYIYASIFYCRYYCRV